MLIGTRTTSLRIVAVNNQPGSFVFGGFYFLFSRLKTNKRGKENNMYTSGAGQMCAFPFRTQYICSLTLTQNQSRKQKSCAGAQRQKATKAQRLKATKAQRKKSRIANRLRTRVIQVGGLTYIQTHLDSGQGQNIRVCVVINRFVRESGAYPNPSRSRTRAKRGHNSIPYNYPTANGGQNIYSNRPTTVCWCS